MLICILRSVPWILALHPNLPVAGGVLVLVGLLLRLSSRKPLVSGLMQRFLALTWLSFGVDS